MTLPWADAWRAALYGPAGFFTGDAGPAAHFRTAVHAAPGPLAAALAALAHEHGRTCVLDVGTGRGELPAALAACPEAADLALHGVDVVARPPGLPGRVGWSQGLAAVPAEAFDDALVVAWELLDDVPCPVLEVDDDGLPRTVLVDPRTGRETLGDPAPPDQLAWCASWWPPTGAEPGDRIEVGSPRDEVWAGLVSAARRTARGATLLAVDYAHDRAGRPPTGTLTGYRSGRAVPPVPDGSCNVTAHVAMDSVAAAGEAAGARTIRLTDSRTALMELGVLAGPLTLPDRSAVAELLDPGSLGSFTWLLQSPSPL